MSDFRSDHYVYNERYREQSPPPYPQRLSNDNDEQRYPDWMEREL